jgi:hypothetical protein
VLLQARESISMMYELWTTYKVEGNLCYSQFVITYQSLDDLMFPIKNMPFYTFMCEPYIIVQLNLSCLSYYIYIYTGSMFFWPVWLSGPKTIEPAVQPVLNGWTSEPVNRRSHRFDYRSGPNNYGRICEKPEQTLVLLCSSLSPIFCVPLNPASVWWIKSLLHNTAAVPWADGVVRKAQGGCHVPLLICGFPFSFWANLLHD